MAIEVVKWKPMQKNSLVGFANIRFTNIGLEIRDCPVHERAGSRWVQMPAKPYQTNGETRYTYILDFYDKRAKEAFQRQTIAALDEYLSRRP